MMQKHCTMMYGNFLFLMVLVLIFIGTVTYHNQQRILKNQQRPSERFFGTDDRESIPLGIEGIVERIVYGMYEAAVTPAAPLQADRNTRYQLWYSNMLRRGVPDAYITPETFDDLYKLVAQSRLSPENVETVIRPIYEYASSERTAPSSLPFRPVCLNY